MLKLYLDIDGVLLTTKQIKAAEYAIEFIDFITDNFECYWLTTHCKGETKAPLSYLAKYFDHYTIKKLSKINPTNWTTLKTEAIDFSSNFIWLEDYPFNSEKMVLTSKNVFEKLIIIDLNNDNELKKVLQILKDF